MITDEWSGHLQKLKEFFELKKTYKVPAAFHTESGFGLGDWVRRQVNNKGQLALTQIRQLDELGAFWMDNIPKDEWEPKFHALERYVELYGCARPGNTFVDGDGTNLGSWVASQRTQYKKSRLDSEKISRLEGLPGWAWDALDAQWQETYEDLLDNVKLKKSVAFAQNYVSKNDKRLGSWLNTQRQRYKAGKMPDQRITKLEAIPGFFWDPFAAIWEESFSKLQQFVETEGHCKVPAAYKLDGLLLGSWVGTQRAQKDFMPSERKQRLDEVGFIWDDKNDKT